MESIDSTHACYEQIELQTRVIDIPQSQVRACSAEIIANFVLIRTDKEKEKCGTIFRVR